MAYVKNWLHCVWGTKNRIQVLKGRMKSDLIEHILENAKEKKIYIDSINGYADHIHCLIALSPDQTLSKTIQLIKGESSLWVNRNFNTNYKFGWADEYFAVSVNESSIPVVRKYIQNQEEHHRKKTWEEEYNDFMSQYNFKVHHV